MPIIENFVTRYPCQHLWNFGKNTKGVIYDSEISYWHHVIDECPDKRKARLYMKCYNPQEIQDYVIVSDSKTGKLYRNKHCAECNGIKEYVNLKLRVMCPDLLSVTNLNNIVDRDRFLLKHCSLMSFPPAKSFGLSNCVPKSNIISVCNYTEKWDFYDKEIEKGCTTESPFENKVFKTRLDISKRNIYFANLYCFLCNTATSTAKTDVCDIEKYDIGMKSDFISLFGILDDAQLWETEPVTVETVCDSTY